MQALQSQMSLVVMHPFQSRTPLNSIMKLNFCCLQVRQVPTIPNQSYCQDSIVKLVFRPLQASIINFLKIMLKLFEICLF